MKSNFTFILLLCQILSLLGQNVGIGTSSPVSKLDVEGGVSIGAAYSGTSTAPVNGAIVQGYVGIGTAAPLGQLHVNNTTWFLAANLQSNSNVGTWLSIGNTDPGGRWFSIIASATNNGEGAGKLLFTRSVAANSTAGTIMTFDHATSNVGIGTTAPTSRLQIIVPDDKNNNPADNGLYVYNAGNAGDNDDAILAARVAGANAGDAFVSFDVSGVTGWSAGLDNSDADKFKIGNSWADPGANTMMTIQTNGSVGIGTTAPATLFHVSGTSNSLMTLQTGTAESDINYIVPSGNWEVGTNTNGNGTSGNQFFVYDNAYRFTIQRGTGNVGVGTNTPSAKLEVNGTSGDENTLGIARVITPAGGANLRMGVVDGSRSWIQSHGALPLYINTLGNNTILNQNASSVGIGTGSPSQKVQINGGQLYVPGFANQNWGNTGTFIENIFGTGDVSFQSGTFSYCIRAEYGTIGDWFACYSDQRIKKDIRPLDHTAALSILNQIEVKHYKYIDYTNHGSQERVGVIAQQVESVFPEAISTLKNFIPNVYQFAQKVSVNEENRSITLTTEIACDCKVGDKVRIYIDKDRDARELEVIAVNANSFTLAKWQINETEAAPRQVFVFGKEISDFRGVDYDRIFILGISAIQELDQKVMELEKMKAEIREMRAAIEALKK